MYHTTLVKQDNLPKETNKKNKPSYKSKQHQTHNDILTIQNLKLQFEVLKFKQY